MTSTKAEPGPFDGLERAKPDEPVFPLVAHDVLAAPLVQLWVDRRRAAINAQFAASEITEEKRQLELEQCREAEEIAWAMVTWREGEEVAAPVPVEQKQPYSGHATTDAELAAKHRFETIREGARRIDNAVAELADVVEKLEPFGFDTERLMLAADIASLKALGDSIRPRRASYAHLGDE